MGSPPLTTDRTVCSELGLTRFCFRQHITPILQHLHLLPIQHQFYFKIIFITYKAFNNIAPTYPTDLLQWRSDDQTPAFCNCNTGGQSLPSVAQPSKRFAAQTHSTHSKIKSNPTPQKSLQSLITTASPNVHFLLLSYFILCICISFQVKHLWVPR